MGIAVLQNVKSLFVHNQLSESSSLSIPPQILHAMPAFPFEVTSQAVEDVGKFVNESNPVTTYMHGLYGVNLYLNWVFVNSLLVSFFGAVVITFVVRLSRRGWKRLRHSHHQQTRPVRRARWQQWLLRHIVLAPLGKHHYSQELRIGRHFRVGTVPPRLFTILFMLYALSNVVYCAILDYKHKNTAELLAELRGRSGALAVANLVPATLFALRNNILISLLGTSYNTCNRIHRWTARVAISEIFVHASCWFTNAVRAGGVQQVKVSLNTSMSYQAGFGAACSFILIGICTLYFVRHASYEIFLLGHRGLVLLGFAGAYVHLERANLVEVQPYIQTCIALWATEWTLRGMWILYLNFDPRHPRQSGTIFIEALPGEASRLTIRLARPWRWRPGCHVHIYIPSVAWGSSHPFSIAWAENDGILQASESQKSTAEKSEAHWARGMTQEVLSTPSDLQSLESNDSRTIAETKHRPCASEVVTSISLVVQARTGMTRRIFEKASASGDGLFQSWGLVEGPYGGVHSLAQFEVAIVFAGGVGITHCLGVVRDLLQKKSTGERQVARIYLVWSVVDGQMVSWVRDWLLDLGAMDGAAQALRIEVFITRACDKVDAASSAQFHAGRCNPEIVLNGVAREWKRPIGVTVCGPARLADSVRAAVRRHDDEGTPLHFVEEAFTY